MDGDTETGAVRHRVHVYTSFFVGVSNLYSRTRMVVICGGETPFVLSFLNDLVSDRRYGMAWRAAGVHFNKARPSSFRGWDDAFLILLFMGSALLLLL